MESLPSVILTVWQGGVSRTVEVHHGQSLREALLQSGLTPYRGLFQQLNCGGLGICGTCKIQVKEKGVWWERRSCQLRCFQAMEIQVE